MKTAILLDFDDTIFDTTRYKTMREHSLEEIAAELTHDDAIKFLEGIDYRKFTPIILTFSLKPDYQNAKVTASGVAKHNLPMIITDQENKTELLTSWLAGGHYNIPGQGQFSEIIFVDDRLKHFAGFSELPNARGFLMQRAEQGSLGDKLPKNVSIVRDFSEIMI
jgi:hypothetical protein